MPGMRGSLKLLEAALAAKKDAEEADCAATCSSQGDQTNGQAQTSEVLKEYKVLKPTKADEDADRQWVGSPGPNGQQTAPDRTISRRGRPAIEVWTRDLRSG